MLELIEASEALSYLLGFWLFLFSPRFRRSVISGWSEAGVSGRIRMVFEGTVATAIGVGFPAMVIWVVMG